MREYGNCGSGYVYNDNSPDLPRTGTEGAPRPRVVRPSPIVLQPIEALPARPKKRAVAPKPKPAPKPMGRRPRAIDPDREAEIARRYRDGDSVRKLRADFGMNYDQVARILDKYSVPRRPSHIRTPEDSADWRCSECQRPMRPHSSRAQDWPSDTVKHRGRGRCVNCGNTADRRARREAARVGAA